MKKATRNTKPKSTSQRLLAKANFIGKEIFINEDSPALLKKKQEAIALLQSNNVPVP